MGACCSSGGAGAETKKRSKELEKAMGKAHEEDAQVSKLLLLGAGESGKSTLFKQMIAIYGNGFPADDRARFVSIIHNNTISSMKTLVDMSRELGEGSAERPAVPGAKITDTAALQAAEAVTAAKVTDPLTPDLAEKVATLWADPGIRATYAVRHTFQLNDSAEYYFNQVDALAKPDYLPTEQDVLRSRVRTTGIVESTFTIDNNKFRMFDAGGQRNERKKWIHCFSEVTAVIFVAALSEFDQVLFEDDTTNRMHEALKLFAEIINSPWFRDTAIILMLNKRDLFEEKIARADLRVCFPEYSGDGSAEDAAEFIKETFCSLNADQARPIYTHLTCATDTNQMRIVFNAVKDIVVRRSLQQGGLLA